MSTPRGCGPLDRVGVGVGVCVSMLVGTRRGCVDDSIPGGGDVPRGVGMSPGGVGVGGWVGGGGPGGV